MSQHLNVELINFFVWPETKEFLSLWDASKWKNQAEAGRKLELTRSAIGKILKGKSRPSSGTLKLFKLVLLMEQPGALTGSVLREAEMEVSEWERDLLREIRDLGADDRSRILNAVRAMVAGLPKPKPDLTRAASFETSDRRPQKETPVDYLKRQHRKKTGPA